MAVAAAAAPKRVAIIGGGVSGLAAYRHITFHPNLKATLFESLPSGLGGLWSSGHAHHRPDMVSNVSRHTMTFSDVAWPDDLRDGRDAFPCASDVERYLKLYADRHLRTEDLRMNTKVTRVERVDGNWRVTTSCSDAANHEEAVDDFEFLVISSGFFSTPYIPPIPGIVGANVAIRHSTEFGTLESHQGQVVAIIGGSLSAVEIAGLLVPYAAKIHHVHTKPFFAVSKYLPTNTPPPEVGKPHFLPLDLVFNRRSTRPDMNERLHPTPETNRLRSAFLSSLYPISSSPWDSDNPAMIGISNQYSGGLRTGAITSHISRLDGIGPDGTLVLSSGDRIQRPDVVVFCTGYTTLLPFLSPSLQRALQYQADNRYVPFLADDLVVHPDLPNAGFVGVYRGPYFAVIELQARYLASLFAGKIEWPSAEEMMEGLELEASIRDTDVVRRTQLPHSDYGGLVEKYARLLSIPSLSHRILADQKPANHAADDVVLAVNYPLVRTPDVQTIESDITETMQYSSRGGWVSAAVFYSWCGRWTVRRTIRDHTLHGMSGTFEGLADFHPRPPSVLPEYAANVPSSSNSCAVSLERGSAHSSGGCGKPEPDVIEYLYHEHGTFTTTTGTSFPASRKYIYRYQPRSDTISVWFCRGPASANEPHCGDIDYWFHDIVVRTGASVIADGSNTIGGANDNGLWFEEHQWKGGWHAVGTEHLCIKDMYRPVYRFCFEGAELREFGVGYDVEGPGKRYQSEAWYTHA